MSQEHNYALILAGGAGSRLWPMSRVTLPKQFQRLTGPETLFAHMLRLTNQVIPAERTFVLSVPEFHPLIREQAPGLPTDNILAEPALRDNGPAIMLGMLEIRRRDPEARVAILWSDHLIQKEEPFVRTLETAFAATKEFPDHLVTVGATPTKADTALGYIHLGEEVRSGTPPVMRVQRFVEKPEQPDADRFVASGEYLWNVGYKLMSVEQFLAEFKRVQPDHAATLDRLADSLDNADALAEVYQALPKLSIEYLFTQYLDNILVVPADIGWSDVGTWNTLYEVLSENDGLATRGTVLTENCSDSLVFAKDRPIAVVGMDDVIVVDTGDVILVMNRNTPASELKKLVQDQIGPSYPELS